MTPDGKAYIENCLEAAKDSLDAQEGRPFNAEEMRACVSQLFCAVTRLFIELDAYQAPELDEIRRGMGPDEGTDPR